MFIHLAPGVPGIDEPTTYCRQSVESIAAIYPLLEKPAPKFIDWPRVTEQGLLDMAAAEKTEGSRIVYLMLLYHDITGRADYLQEARAAADRLLQMGCEFRYEFTTTALAPIGLLRLYKSTGDRRFLEGIAIPLAALLHHTWLFNPNYGEYRGRTLFLLTEAMPGIYANGWEEGTMMHYLNKFLLEGRELLPAQVRGMINPLGAAGAIDRFLSSLERTKTREFFAMPMLSSNLRRLQPCEGLISPSMDYIVSYDHFRGEAPAQ